MPIGPILETERLILRPPAAEDFDGFCELMADQEAAKYIGGVQEPPTVWRGMAALTGGWTLNGFSMWSAIDKTSGEWVGRLGPYRPHGWPGAEIGWSLKRSAWGKGYATEGAAAAMDYVFDILGWSGVIHCIDPDNIGSIKLAERLGSGFAGPVTLPPPFSDLPSHAYGQTAQEWKTNRAGLITPA